ncbi:hypothetical protein ACJ41O_001522 [Fusarium nematophilum]
MASEGYMMDPPEGEGRWEAGTMAQAQQAIGAALFTSGTIIYFLRIYTRIGLLNNPLRTDDCGFDGRIIDILLGVLRVHHGDGRTWRMCQELLAGNDGDVRNPSQGTLHRFTTISTHQPDNSQWTIPVNIFYMLSSDLAKISLLFFYLRLCPERNFRILVQVLAGLFSLYAVIYAMISLFGCQPIKANWDLAAQATGKCVDKFGFFLAASVANVVMDLVILLLPLRIVIPLQIPRRQKISLLFLFTTGGFVIIVAIYNCILTVKLFSSPNYTWGLAYELCWMYAELTGCVICASASSLKPLFTKLLPGLLSSRGHSYGNSHANTTKGSYAIKSRSHLSRKQPDAIELQSGDDSESGRKVGDDDETKLWPRPEGLEDDAGHTVLVSTNKAPRER